MRLLTFLILSLLAFPFALAARVSMADGGTSLPDKFITAICRDIHGLMWIGTKQGVCNYDGTRFEPLEGDLKNDAAVTRLIYDANADRLWAATSKGLYVIDCGAQTTTFISNKKDWNRKTVADICLFPDGSLCAAYVEGEIARISKHGEILLLTKLEPEGSRPLYAHRLEADGTEGLKYQVINHSDWYTLHLQSKQNRKLPALANQTTYMRHFGDTTFAEIREGGCTMTKGAAPLYPKAQRLFAGTSNVIDVLFSAPNKLYILCKQARLYHVNLAEGKADTISSDLFKEKLGTCLYLDKDKILWVGTNKGLLKVTPDKQLFTSMLVQTPPLSVRSLAEDDAGNIYAGTYSGLYRYTPANKQWKKIHSEIFYAMLNVPGPYLYLITEQLRLFRLDKHSLQIQQDFYQNKLPPEASTIWSSSLAWTPDSTIWIGTGVGLYVYDLPTNTLKAANTPRLPEHTRVVHIAHARNGNLWLSTRSGAFELDPRKGIVRTLNAHSKPALPVSSVDYIYEDAKGLLWLCTQSGGINVVDPSSKEIQVLTTESGLSDNETYHLIWEGDQRIWIGTFNGLSSYYPATKTFRNYFVEDGLPSNEFNHNAYLRATSGQVYFGGINGIATFNPDSIAGARTNSRLLVSSITKWDNKHQAFLHLNTIDTSSAIVLNSLDHSLTFNLALDDYENPEAQIFQYRIKGLFNDWVTLKSQHTLRLDGLAPGTYVLEIKAIDRRGAPAANMLHYKIVVKQLFYRTAWFYLLLFVVASGLLWAFFYLRLQHVKRVQRIRERLASDLHDEVGSLLTRITMTSDNLQYSKNSDADRTTKLQKIASLSRNAASSMSDILWAIDARNDYTGNLADRMREHAEEMLNTIDVHPEFEFSVNQRMSIPSELRQQLYLLYKEAINNIVKHSKPTEVRIRYHHNEQGFELSIHNDGVFEKDRPSNGQGLKNIKMRAERVGAKAEIRTEGDRFLVTVES